MPRKSAAEEIVDPGKKPVIEKLIDLSEAAELICVHPQTLATLARKHKAPGVMIGRRWKFRPSSLERWLDELEQERGRTG